MDGTLPASPGQAAYPSGAEFDHDRILTIPIEWLKPSPENEQLYRPVNPDDPDIIALAASIEADGVHETLVATRDGWIISGHRRYVAAKLAGLQEIPVRFHPIRKDEDHDEFMRLLRDCNRQRVKSFDEKLREEIVSCSAEEAHKALVNYREKTAFDAIDATVMELRDEIRRAAITKAKWPFLEAIKKVLEARKKFWPLSKRKIHYCLLNNPPLKHASKPDSIYINDPFSYKSVVELTTRAVFEGLLPWDAIGDDTRPVITWTAYNDVADFIRTELENLFRGYWRNLMRSQPNHLEIVGEKVTLAGVIKPVAAEYTIPLTLGRGFCSNPPRKAMAQRFKRSGKENLVVLFLSDFDPAGEVIAESFARKMRDDFDIRNIKPIKVALTSEQARRLDLPPGFEPAKAKDSPHYDYFVEKYGTDTVFELEAIPEASLQDMLRDTIDSVIDVDLFNHESEQEAEDAKKLEDARRVVFAALRQIGFTGESEPA